MILREIRHIKFNIVLILYVNIIIRTNNDFSNIIIFATVNGQKIHSQRYYLKYEYIEGWKI